MMDSEYTTIKVPNAIYRDIERDVVSLYKELHICTIPINPWDIARRKGYKIVPYSHVGREKVACLKRCGIEGGASYLDKKENSRYIIYNDTYLASKSFQKFTIMHELGHIVLGHKEDSELAERLANYFAAYALAPSPLIYKYCCEDKEDLMTIFQVSEPCANICFGRYLKWQTYGGKLKDYEIELLDLVK